MIQSCFDPLICFITSNKITGFSKEIIFSLWYTLSGIITNVLENRGRKKYEKKYFNTAIRNQKEIRQNLLKVPS